jgi:hypothetical protein
MSTARPNGLPANLKVTRFVRDGHFYVVAGVPGAEMHYGIWGAIGTLRPSAYRGADSVESAIRRLTGEGYQVAPSVPELDPKRAVGARNLDRLARELFWNDGRTTEVDLEPAFAAVPAVRSLGTQGGDYDRAALVELIRWAGQTFATRMKANQSARDRKPAPPTLSRYINPDPLEKVRPISRSTDSSWGNVIGELATKMAQARFGESAPSVYRGRFVDPDEPLPAPRHKGKQYVAHRVDADALDAEVARVYTKERGLDHDAFERLRRNPPRATGAISLTDVDLLYRDDDDRLRVFEMKASGQLDVKNGPANARAILARAVLAGADAEPYYSSIQRESSGATTERDMPGRAVGAADFWSALLPKGMGYAEFEELLETTLAPYKEELSIWLDRRAS